MSNEQRCCHTKFRNWGRAQCRNKAKVVRDGKGYCRTHDPVAADARHAAREALWDAESKMREARAEAYKARAAIIDSCLFWLNIQDGTDIKIPRQLVRELADAESAADAAAQAVKEIRENRKKRA